MVIIRVLKRKDASSVVVAIIVALIVLTVLGNVTAELTNEITGVNQAFQGGPSWEEIYLQPTVSAVLQLLALELLCWLYILGSNLAKNLPVNAPKRK